MSGHHGKRPRLSQPVSARLDLDVLAAADAAAARLGINRSTFIDRAMASYVASVQRLPLTDQEDAALREDIEHALADGAMDVVHVVRPPADAPRRSVFQVEFENDELFAVMATARARGMRTGELIRRAALAQVPRVQTVCSGGATVVWREDAGPVAWYQV